MKLSQTGVDQTFIATIERIADDVAAPNADDVDRAARFPSETIDALREERALSAFVPPELGGLGVNLETLAEACFVLGRRCGASAMVFAMHQIQVHSIVRHHAGSDWFRSYLEQLTREQRLIASATSEVGTGGDMGRSVATVIEDGDGQATFEKQAPTISYGAHAEDLFTTVRRSPDADAGDQVIVLTMGDQATLTPTGSWDPLGMRGTCSPGATVNARFPSEQVLPTAFVQVSAESMVPCSHILWSHLWLGIATDAFDRARAFVRAAARRAQGATPPAATRLSHVLSELSLLRSVVRLALDEYLEAVENDPASLSTMAGAVRINNLKIAASEQAPKVCQGALGVCGIVGYKNDTPFSVGRHLRDSMSACLMVANERIHATNAGLLLVTKEI